MKRLSDPLTFQRAQRPPDGMGGTLETWQDAFTDWGSVRGLGAAERIRAMQAGAESTHRIEVRYREDVRPGMRVVRYGEVYEIGAPVDRRGDGRYIAMDARRLW